MSELDEGALIARMCERVGVAKAPEGPGDDAALFEEHVVTVDLMVEGVHFLRAHPPRWLGAKLLAVNLSDVGAMGATPSRCVLSAAIPSDTPMAWWDAFAAGFGELAERAGVALVGGDVTRSPGPLMLGVTAWGELRGSRALLRSGASEGELLMIHSPQGIGRSSRGLRTWLEMKREGWTEALVHEADPCLIAHLCPQTSWQMGPWASQMGASAAMDCSDGLFSDLPKLAAQSGLAFEVELSWLPTDPLCTDMSPQERAAGGEDYGLIVTVSPEHRGVFEAQGFVALGWARAGSGVTWTLEGVALHATAAEFEHFRQP